jgi:hypothetical protein
MPNRRVQPGRRLVQNEQLRVRKQCANKSEPALHAAGKRADGRVALVVEGHVSEKFVDPRKCGVLGEAFEAGVKLHVFKDCQLFIESVLLCHHAETLLDAARLERGIVAKDFEVSAAAKDDAVKAAYER